MGREGGNENRVPQLASELVRLKVDIIVVAGGAPAIRAAMNATKTIPIVMAGLGIDPVGAGLVQSLARPGGNVTGVTILSRELAVSGWSCSKKPFPELPASRFSTMRLVRALSPT